MKFIDISGFGNSGKSTLTDLFKEFDGFVVPHYNFEFNLLRIQDGLLDLKNNLVENWSPIRSNSAINRFNKLVKKIGPSANLFKPSSLFYSNGMNYDSIFSNEFSNLSNKYISELVAHKYTSYWPYDSIELTPMSQFLLRLRSKIIPNELQNSTISLTSVGEDEFNKITHEYISNLFKTINTNEGNTFVTHNSLEPFNPKKGLELFPNGKAIVVQRDPRDIYASTIVSDLGYLPNFETKKQWKVKRSFLNTNDVIKFCERQLIYRNHVNSCESKDILRLNYEDLILNYEFTIEKIFTFLELEKSIHMSKFKFFNPKNSVKNIGLWKKANRNNEIQIIEETLSCFLFNHN